MNDAPRINPISWTLANGLTLARLVVGFAFPWISPAWRPTVALAACISDGVDGAVSRMFRGQSGIGQMLDPIADKVFVLSVVITLLFEGTLTWWQVLLVGMRDWVVLGLLGWILMTSRAHRIPEMVPRWTGKVATAAQFVFLMNALLNYWPVGGPLFVITAALSTVAAIDYYRAGWQASKLGKLEGA